MKSGLFYLLPVDVISGRGPNNDGKDDAGDQKDDEKGEEESAAHGEVDLGLESEQGESQSDSGRDAHSNQDGVHVIVAGDCAQHDALAHREDAQKDEVVRSLPSDAGEAGEGYDADKGQAPAGVHQPSVLPDVALYAVHEDKERDDGGRDDQLDHQDAVDSLDEAAPHCLVIKSSRSKVVRSTTLRILPFSLAVGRWLLVNHTRERLLLRLRRILRISLRLGNKTLLRVALLLIVVGILGVSGRLDKTLNKIKQ